jgi:hypothetical protein
MFLPFPSIVIFLCTGGETRMLTLSVSILIPLGGRQDSQALNLFFNLCTGGETRMLTLSVSILIPLGGRQDSQALNLFFNLCTGGETRTPSQRFWRPLLYQLSYTRVFFEVFLLLGPFEPATRTLNSKGLQR